MGRYPTVRSAERIGGSPAPRSRTSARSPLPPNPARAVSDRDRAEAPLGRQRPLPGWTRTTPRLAPPDQPATDSARCTAQHQKVFVLLDRKGLESPLPERAEGDIVNCESVPGKMGSLSVSSYSPHSMRAIHYVPLRPPEVIAPAVSE